MIEEWKIWKDTSYKSNGYKNPLGGLYEVSNLGRLRKNGEIVELKIGNSGYLGYGEMIHRIVAECFIPNPENKKEVDHIDGNKLNNKVNNLRWVSSSENKNNPNTYYKWLETHPRGKMPEETRKKIKEANKKWWEEKGNHHSEETRKLMSDIRREWWANHEMSEEEHKRRSEGHKGKKFTEETRKKMSENRSGEKHPLYGKHHSEETRKKIGEKSKGRIPVNKGIPASEETRKKISEKAKGRKRVYRDDGTYYMTK